MAKRNSQRTSAVLHLVTSEAHADQPQDNRHRALGGGDDSEGVPVGIFTANHPDKDKPNFLQAEMILERIEFERKQAGGILRALMELNPQPIDSMMGALLMAVYRLNEDERPLRSLRKTLCLQAPDAANSVGGHHA